MKKTRVGIVAAAVVCGFGISGAVAARIAPGDVVLYQVGDATTSANTNGAPLILEDINPATSAAVVAVDASTQSNPLYTTNEGSLGDISLINNGTAIAFTGWTSTITTGTLSSTNAVRGAGVLGLDGSYSTPATFTLATAPTATDQVRSVTSLDGSNFYFADKTGFYYSGGANNSATPLTPNTTVNNYRGIKNFGGTIYAVSQNNTPFIASIAPTSTTVSETALPGTALAGADSKVQDFTMLSSGLNGNVFDTLYTLDTGSKAAINKYFNNGTAWVAEGSLSLTGAGSGLTGATGLGAQAVPGGVELYVTDNGTSSFLAELQDTATANNSITVAAAQVTAPTVLYTAPTGDILDGVVAVPEPGSIALLAISTLPLLARRRKA